MISKQESIISTIDPSEYLDHRDYLLDLSSATRKLHRLEQELAILGSGKLAQDV